MKKIINYISLYTHFLCIKMYVRRYLFNRHVVLMSGRDTIIDHLNGMCKHSQALYFRNKIMLPVLVTLVSVTIQVGILYINAI